MSISEFDLIQRFFRQENHLRPDVMLGVGDDAAVLSVPRDQQLVVSTDTLVEGRHFPKDTSPADIGFKALAVNLSDLAAMGAEPAWVLLALTLPMADEGWLSEFSQGFFSLLQRFRLQLVGGDVTCGPLTITVQALGFVPIGKALRRGTAMPGDRIYVTGTLGDAGLALACLQNKANFSLTEGQVQQIMHRLNRPEPRIELGLALRGIANSAVDISDGLVADLSHILSASQVGAKIQAVDLPLSASLRSLPCEQAWRYALTAGDDYELCFTVPASCDLALQQQLMGSNTSYTCIGSIKKELGLSVLGEDKSELVLAKIGFQHFSE